MIDQLQKPEIEPETRVFKVVITGGPCAGKSTVLKNLEAGLGEKIVVVPEAATLLLTGGYPEPNGSDLWMECFQTAVVATQYSLERTALERAQSVGAKLLVCDRGLHDNEAYFCGASQLLQDLQNGQDEFGIYDRVIHLESLATADEERFGTGNNPNRYEDLAQACQLEYDTRRAWEQHPDRHIITGSDLSEKIRLATKLVSELIV